MSSKLDGLRGMSEPFPFSFTITKPDKVMVCHSVIFTSYEVRDGNAQIGLLADDSDPRMAHLLKYIWSNFLKEKRTELEECLKRAEQAESVIAAAAMGKKHAEEGK